MILRASLDLEGPIDLFDEEKADDLVGEGEGREAPLPVGFLEYCCWQAFGSSDDKRKARSSLKNPFFQFLTEGLARDKLSFDIEGDDERK